MRPRLPARKHGRTFRLHGHGADVRVAFLQIFRRARQGAARSHARHDAVEAAVGIEPQLGPGGAVVRFGVVGVGELPHDDAVFMFAVQLLGLVDGALHPQSAGREHDLGAVGGKQLAALFAHGLGHGQNQRIALYCAHARQPDARIAAGRLDEQGIFADLASLFQAADHVQGGAVFHAARGVQIFQLRKHFGARPKAAFHAVQPQQRRLADQVFDRLVDHLVSPCGCYVSHITIIPRVFVFVKGKKKKSRLRLFQKRKCKRKTAAAGATILRLHFDREYDIL